MDDHHPINFNGYFVGLAQFSLETSKLIRKKKVQTEKNVKPKTWSNILGLSLLVHQTTHFSQMIRFVPRHLTRYFHNIGKSAIFCVKTRPFSNSIL